MTPIICFARGSRGKEGNAWADLDNDSDDSASARYTEANVNTGSGHELKTRRGSFVKAISRS